MSMAAANVPIADVPRLSFFSGGIAEAHSIKKLQATFAEIGERIVKQLEDISTQLVRCSTVEEFCTLRDKKFQSYVQLSRAISYIVLANNDAKDYVRLAQEALLATEQEFLKEAAAYLGDEAYKEARFSISTLVSAQRLIPRVVLMEPLDRTKDRELANNYTLSNMWAHLHWDCLRAAIRLAVPLSQGIIDELLEGLRLSVMAYGYVRAALDLRDFHAERYREKPGTTWDDEDEALANAK